MKSTKANGTNLSALPLPSNPYPKEPALGNIRTKQVGDKEFVHASDLYHSEQNEKLYGEAGTPDWSTSVYDLIEKFEERFKETNDQFSLQVQPAVIYPDGLIDTGNTRSLAIRMWADTCGLEPWLWVSRISGQPPGTAYEQQKQLGESNITRKENAFQQYRRFDQMRGAFCDYQQTSHDAALRTTPLEKLNRVDACTMEGVYKECKVSLTWDNIKKMDTVVRGEDILKNKFPQWHQQGKWKKIIGTTKGIDFYYELVTGISNGSKLVEDKFPNRDWTVILTPDRLRLAATLTKEWITAHVSTGMITVRGSKQTTNFAPFSEFEDSAIIPVYSHGFNVILAEVLRNDGFKVTTPATNATFDFDLVFEFAGGPTGPEYDKAEVKFTTYNGANTQWKGGHGKREGEFILVAVENKWQSIFIATTRLTRHDWQPAGRDGTHCKVATVLQEHRDELQYAAGNLIKKQSGAVEVQTVPFPWERPR